MDNAKHTPGPWNWVKARTMQHLHGTSGYFGISLSLPERGSNMRFNTPEYRERIEADACLIAAAPDCAYGLAGLLSWVVNHCDLTDEDLLPHIFKARAAIAKAKGENHAASI